MGQVFAAEDLALGLPVAIKVPALNIILAPNGPERFLKEARIAARLGPHRNVVQIKACLTDPNLAIQSSYGRGVCPIPFIVMEFLGGGNLGQRVGEEEFSLSKIESMFAEICSAVACAHSCEYRDGSKMFRGVVHRDLKPSNICFDDHDRLVVVDFGLARLLEDSSYSSGVVGTPPYMAPEQWNTEYAIDHRTDIYALGIILFELATGNRPFRGETAQELKNSHLHTRPPDPRILRSDLPDGVAKALLRALEKSKDDRFDRVDHFADAVAEGFQNAPRLSTRDYRNRGDALARRERYDEAIVEYDRALRDNSRDVLTIINRGYCLYRKGLFAEAIVEYTRALGIDPTHAEAWNNRGVVWKDIGEYEKSIVDFRQALRFNPNHPLTPNNLRDSLEKLVNE